MKTEDAGDYGGTCDTCSQGRAKPGHRCCSYCERCDPAEDKLELLRDEIDDVDERQEIDDPKATGEPRCVWRQDEDGNWDGECGVKWVLMEGGPVANTMRFCPACGARLKEMVSHG